MKKIIFLLICSVYTIVLYPQKVDSIRVEQTGDFIKIKYKILDSKPDQVFRVRILCSLNGGLNTELNNITGDTGDQVLGGKSEYWVVWDVLKDVDEVKSVDFIVRAELVKDLSTSSQQVVAGNSSGWDKKRINVLPVMMGPGPKFGLRIGYMGSFGISAQLTSGKIEKGNVDYDPGKSAALGVDVTKRVFNRNGFQMHLMVGFQELDLLYYEPLNAERYNIKGTRGPEAGLMFGLKRASFSIIFSHIDPGKIERGSDFEAVSPLSYFTLGFGVRF